MRRADRSSLRADALAGLTGAILALPQGVAYAAIAGLPPEYGLYTAIVTAIVAALFGSSRHLVSGPAAPISIVVASVAASAVPADSAAYLSYVLALTCLAGVFQLVLGLARLGVLVNFISHTVVVGFTAGAAFLIAASQLPSLLGTPHPDSAALIPTLMAVARDAGDFNPACAAVGGVTLLCAVLVRRLRPHWPALLAGMAGGAAAAAVLPASLGAIPMVGAMGGTLPTPSVPPLSLETVRTLTPGALALGLIGLIEALAIARAISLRSGQRIDANQEFIGQGLSNIAGSFFSCYAGSGSFTRSAANYEAGARTPLATIVAAAVVALVLVAAPGATAYLPTPAVAAVVLLIAWNLVEIGQIRQILRADRGETAVLLVTFLATLFLALEFAVYVGVLTSLVLFLARAATPRLVPVAPVPTRAERPLRNAARRGLDECPQMRILRVDGALFFGAVEHTARVLAGERAAGRRHVMLVGSAVNFVDVAGAELLAGEAEAFRREGGSLALCSFKDPALSAVTRGGYLERIGEENVFRSPDDAIAALFDRLDPEICRHCRARIFTECARAPGPE